MVDGIIGASITTGQIIKLKETIEESNKITKKQNSIMIVLTSILVILTTILIFLSIGLIIL